jgi:hypothetical protein
MNMARKVYESVSYTGSGNKGSWVRRPHQIPLD